MPRPAAEPARRQSLIDAALATIGEQGSLDVSVKQIAARAGMSPALAFHYFGDKQAIVVETMRYLLREFAAEARAGLNGAETPRARVSAVIAASFAPSQFERTTVAAWLVFYLHAQQSAEAARLLAIYQSRLRSNLMTGLVPLAGRIEADAIAESLAALIDGLFIRHALREAGPSAARATALCEALVEARLATSGKPRP